MSSNAWLIASAERSAVPLNIMCSRKWLTPISGGASSRAPVFTKKPAAAEWAELSWGPVGPVSTPASDTPVDGFTLGVSSGGEFHYHYKIALKGPNAPGVYLLTMTMWSTSGSIAESEPIYLLLNNDMDQATLDLAAGWWADNGAWCSASSCIADFNGDGTVNTQDFLAYLNAWSAQDPRADVNGDGVVNTQDFLAFLNLWTAGC